MAISVESVGCTYPRRGADKIPDREGFGNHGGEVFVDLILSAILDDQALSLAAASQLRLDRQDDGIEIGPLALFPCSAAAIFAWLSRIPDPISRPQASRG